MADGRLIAFTGGGSGGHIFPGLAVIEALRERGFRGRIEWIGSEKASDREAVEAAGVEYHEIPSGKLRRQFTWANAVDALRVIAGWSASRRILRKLRPTLLFSKGGYVSVPPVAAAAGLGIPCFTHESDLTAGLATRLNARKSEKVLLSYEASLPLLNASIAAKAVVVGNPVRSSIRKGDSARGRAFAQAGDGLPIALFLGGSQGARQINELVAAVLPGLAGKAFVIHQAGAAAMADGLAAPQGAVDRYRPLGFVRDEMADLVAAADVVVGRAGAGTLWEASALGKPLLLIPLYGSGTRGDQVDNARLFAKDGAAVTLVGAEATPERLLSELLALLSDEPRRKAMGEAARNLAGADAAATIADMIITRIGGLS